MKYSENKKRNKFNNKNDKEIMNGNKIEILNNSVDESKDKEKAKKKSRLKRRKRVRKTSLCDSELSDSDITINDSSSENEFPSGDSESDDDVSSGGESLDETLLIIDQKIKEKKSKDEQKNIETNGFVKNNEINNDSKHLNDVDSIKSSCVDIKDLENEIFKSGMIEQNGIKGNEKDKTKSLFTISNGIGVGKECNEDAGGDYLEESALETDSANGNAVSETTTNESSEQG